MERGAEIYSIHEKCLLRGIKCSPYEAMFGTKDKVGLATSSLPKNIVFILKTEEDFEEALKKNTYSNIIIHFTSSINIDVLWTY